MSDDSTKRSESALAALSTETAPAPTKSKEDPNHG